MFPLKAKRRLLQHASMERDETDAKKRKERENEKK